MLNETEIKKEMNFADTQMQIIHVLRRHGKKGFKTTGMERYFVTEFYQYIEDFNNDPP